MKLYSIVGWGKNFEVAQSKRIQKSLPWVALPTKHDGKSYRRLMRMPDGPSIYCAWVLILQVAAKCDTRGVLADSDGPLSADDLEIKTDCPASLFERAFEVLCDPKMGWLSASEWVENEPEINRPSTVVNRPSTVVDQPLTTLRTRTNERTDITDGHNEQGRLDRSNDDDLSKAIAANKTAAAIAKRIPLPKRADKELALKVGLLVSEKTIPPVWARSAAEAVANKSPPPKRPIGYFRSCLEESCRDNGKNLAALLDSVEIACATGPPVGRAEAFEPIPQALLPSANDP